MAEGYLVFSQGPAGVPDIDAWDAQARRFFDARLGLATEPRPAGPGVLLGVVVAPRAGAPGIRSLLGRPRDPGDLALAERAEAKAAGAGLALLARRCESVWLVHREDERDPIALLLAAVLASALFGPVVDVDTTEIFGVKSARARLAGM